MWFEYAAIGAVALAGHVVLVVWVVNRLMGLRLACSQLWLVSRCHLVALAGIPALALWESAPHAAAGSPATWWAQAPGWQAYGALCFAAAAAALIEIVRRACHRPPAALLSNHTETHNVAAELGYRPVGRGRHRWLARLPGNEQFLLQVSQKRLVLPRLPAEWDGLSILHLSDLHFANTIERPFFDTVIERSAALGADLIVFTGDLLDDMQRLDWLEGTLGRLTAPLGCYFVLGNHDWFLEPGAIRRQLDEFGWRDLAGRCVEIAVGAQRLGLAGTEIPWMGAHPVLSGAEDCAAVLLLSHTPDNLPWARRSGIDLMLAGHVHGGQIRLPGVGPLYVPSRFGGRYAAGTFWEAPTMLHVSRGISGRHPLRYRCPPEIVKLVLHTVPA